MSIPDTEAKKKWDKENTTKILLKLNHNTDADIISALEPNKPKQTQIKELLRKTFPVRDADLAVAEVSSQYISDTFKEALQRGDKMSGNNEKTAENKVWEFERDRSVLIVIDMQNDFVLEGAVMQVKEALRQVPKIQKLISKCRELGVPVIYTLQDTDPVFCPLEVAAKPILKTTGMRKGTRGYEIIDELAPRPGDVLISKRRFSAFFQTDMEIILKNIRGRDNPVDTVIICGTLTNVCCESTARNAYFRDYKVVLGTDVCSAHSPEAHNATVENMIFLGRAMDSDSIIKALEDGKG